jgi:hypothetical protein
MVFGWRFHLLLEKPVTETLITGRSALSTPVGDIGRPDVRQRIGFRPVNEHDSVLVVCYLRDRSVGMADYRHANRSGRCW